ncbi:MAG TPA: SHOCT domain-containing protein [Acidimicrobiales bacterium]|nr:SHOCT domain-containing protein [Acidimicrobiales bacterium]
MGRPGVIGMAARTAVVAGTATAVSGRVARRQQSKYQQEAEAEAYPAQAAPPPPPPAPAPAGEDAVITQLQQLADLKNQGVLTEAEFEAQKARILGT